MFRPSKPPNGGPLDFSFRDFFRTVFGVNTTSLKPIEVKQALEDPETRNQVSKIVEAKVLADRRALLQQTLAEAEEHAKHTPY